MSNKIPNTEDKPRMTGERPVVFSGPNTKKNEKSRFSALGLIMIFASLGFTLGTITLLFTSQNEAPSVVEPTAPATLTTVPTEIVVQVTPNPETEVLSETAIPSIISENSLPTIAPDQIQTLLSSYPNDQQNTVLLGVQQVNPFTTSPVRARSSLIQHRVVENETIDNIAARYNINTSSIAWSNSREIMQRFLRPGDVLNIPPVDGVLIQSTGSLRSFRDYANDYGVDDPFIIVDSPYNPHLRGYNPDDVPPDGTQMFIAGGTSFDVVWPMAVEIIEESSGSSSSGWSGGTGRGSQGEDTVFRVTFQNGQPGSCAPQVAEGASVWVNPLQGSYRFVRGFTPGYHDGIDLAASLGTPIVAANGGRVVFSGWNTFGYGNMVAIVHGQTMTVYAHMVDLPSVGCGQFVTAGQTIGFVGSTGISSGPHLHFEIMVRQGNSYVRTDPMATIEF